MGRLVSLEEIKQAAERLKGIIVPTPVRYSYTFSDFFHSKVFLKAENLQKTGSFKIRGAYHKLSQMGEGERKKGIIAASAGNHAQGVALAAGILGIRARVVMPEKAPISKVMATERYGARVILGGKHYGESQEISREIAREEGLTLVHPFDDPLIIAGQGTLGLEILKEVKEAQAVIVPVGGGGLISGIAAAVKGLCPGVEIIGVQSENCAAACQSFGMGKVISLDRGPTIADGIAVEKPGELTFQHIQGLVDRMVTVQEDDIARAVLMLLERTKLMVEGAGAVGIAALLDPGLDLAGKRVVVVLSGGNIDINLLARIIDRGLARVGRLVKIKALIADCPGSLHALLEIIAGQKANILTIRHDRLGVDLPVGHARVELVLETRDLEHSRQLVVALEKKNIPIETDFLAEEDKKTF